MIHLPADHVRFTITRDAKTDRSAVFVIFALLGRRSDDKNSAGRQALEWKFVKDVEGWGGSWYCWLTA
mgnify:CR=1 FL=1